jgi:hypothetical protein
MLACRLQIDAVPDPAYHFDADPDPDFYLMRIRIRVPKMMRIRIHKTGIKNMHLSTTLVRLSNSLPLLQTHKNEKSNQRAVNLITE